MYFNLEYYFAMLRRIWRSMAYPRRRHLLLRLLLAVPVSYVFHSLCFILDRILFPGLWLQKVEKPVFIIGHARSGTTLMHRLMAADTERFSYLLYWEMFFPSLLQKKIIRGLGLVDGKLLNGFFFKKLQAWDEKTYGRFRHVHNMGLWIPEEDDFLMTATFYSGYWQLQAPMMDIMDMFYLDRQPAKRRQRVMRHYRECIRRQLYLNGGNKIHLSKNPAYCGRVQTLIDAFPDASFVVMVRKPIECVPSNARLMESNYKGKGWTADDYAASLNILEEMSYDTYRLPRQVLESNPRIPRAIVDYRELVSHPQATVEKVYADLGLSLSETYRQRLAERNAEAKAHTSRHRYSAEEYGIDEKKMRGELDEFYREFGWD